MEKKIIDNSNVNISVQPKVVWSKTWVRKWEKKAEKRINNAQKCLFVVHLRDLKSSFCVRYVDNLSWYYRYIYNLLKQRHSARGISLPFFGEIECDVMFRSNNVMFVQTLNVWVCVCVLLELYFLNMVYNDVL